MNIKVTSFLNSNWKRNLIVELPSPDEKVLNYSISVYYSNNDKPLKFNLVPVSNNKEETFQFILDSKKCKYFISVIAKVFGCFKENEIEYTHFYDNTQNFF